MHGSRPIQSPVWNLTIGLAILGFLVLGFTSCQSSHRPTQRAEVRADDGWPKANDAFRQVSYERLEGAVPEIPDAEFVNDDELCQSCHEAYVKTFQQNVHRGDSCESCHGPASRHLETRGKEPGLILSFKTMSPTEKSEACLKCHEQDPCAPGAQYRYSKHAHCGVACTDCHDAHYNVPEGTPVTTEPGQSARGVEPDDVLLRLIAYQEDEYGGLPSLAGTSNNLGAVAPYTCYKCHGEMQQYQEIAGPHQICGPNGFNCTTCHDPHGKIKEETRVDLCLECHNQSTPTMAWHSSIHHLQGVACTDCHNPHPNTHVGRLVNISRTAVRRPERLPMAVQEPEACYQCHPDIFGRNSLPSHHPIKEGIMVCSDCHDAHGQYKRNLKAETVNLLCWKCHADKQGPFVYEHPPVTENCAYCHEPHGTVANNLLHQPTTFLCLRCHSGHRRRHGFSDIDNNVDMQNAFYTDCTACHTEIHGSDLPGSVRKQSLRR